MELRLLSPDFENNGWIPDASSGFGADRSPEFRVEGIEGNAASMMITMDDLGLPFTPRYSHWVAWNLPVTERIPGGIPKGASVDRPIHAEQGIGYGKYGYRGPKPPFNWNHEYLFTLYVLDCTLTMPSDSKRDDILKAAEGHILQKTELRGRYQRHHA